MENILTKKIEAGRSDWVKRLPEAVWAYNTTWKTTTGFSPYELVYGENPLFPIEFELQTLRISIKLGIELDATQKEKILQLNELDELRMESLQ